MGLQTYRRKVTEAQAIQFTGDPVPLRSVGVRIKDVQGSGGAFGSWATVQRASSVQALPDWRLHVAKHDEWAQIAEGDWVIAELDGSGFYPCRADVFAATYEDDAL